MPPSLKPNLPRIDIEIFRPGDHGKFVIKVIDTAMQKEICINTLPANVGNMQYLYVARLLEGKTGARPVNAVADDSWKKADRYKDIVRYGQKLYTDVFGEQGEFAKYMKKAAHLKNGVQYVLRLRNTARK